MSCEGCEEGAYVIDALAKLLAEIAIIVNGPEPPLTRWSYHDLPEKVRALKQAPPAALAVPAGYALVPAASLADALSAVDGLMEDAYNRGHQVCCGQGRGECCGNSIVEWGPADDAIMSGLQATRAMLASMLAAAERAQGECPHAARCDCLGGCKRGMRGNGAVEVKP